MVKELNVAFLRFFSSEIVAGIFLPAPDTIRSHVGWAVFLGSTGFIPAFCQVRVEPCAFSFWDCTLPLYSLFILVDSGAGCRIPSTNNSH